MIRGRRISESSRQTSILLRQINHQVNLFPEDRSVYSRSFKLLSKQTGIS